MRRSIGTVRSARLLVPLCLVGCLAAWAIASPGDSPETRDVKATLARQAARVESLDVSYKRSTSSGMKPGQLRALADFRNQIFLPNEEWREATRGRNRYTRRVQPETVDYLAQTDAYGLVPPQDVDPKAPEAVREGQRRMREQYDRAVATMKVLESQGVKSPAHTGKARDLMERDVTRATNGRSLWMRRPMTEKVDDYQTWPAGFQGNWFGLSAYQAAVGLQPTDPTSKATAEGLAAFRLADWIKNRPYALEEKTATVGGSTCVVLKGTWNSILKPAIVVGEIGDRIWLDRDHGLAIRRRELSLGGRLTDRWENSDLREVAPGLWLAAAVRHDRFAADAPEGWAEKHVMTEEIRVRNVEVNQVGDEIFDMPVPKEGDRIEDLRGIF